MVESEGICKTHVLEMNAPDRVLARRFDVIREPEQFLRMRRISLFLLRLSADTIWRELLGGDTRGGSYSNDLGFSSNDELKEGAKLPEPFLEVSTKFEV